MLKHQHKHKQVPMASLLKILIFLKMYQASLDCFWRIRLLYKTKEKCRSFHKIFKDSFFVFNKGKKGFNKDLFTNQF
jgi:hypothetical protein